MIRRSWLELARELSAEAVAEALGLEPGRPASGRPTYSCPACGAATRHTKRRDKRGAVGLTGNGSGWRCHQCEAGGDGIDMAASAIGGARFRDLRSADQNRVRTWLTDRWPELDGGAPRRRGGAGGHVRPLVRAVSPPEPEPVYPPPGEVAALWGRSGPVDCDGEVNAYLEGRALEPSEVAAADLARALPTGSPLPSWAKGPRGNWLETGHRLVCPLWSPSGELRSLIARAVGPAEPKSLAPAGFARKGLVLADQLAVQVLKVEGLPSWWDRDVPLRVVLAEGEPDWLTWATGPEALADSGHGPACLGLFNGGLPQELVAKLPRGSEVVIAEQRDEPRGDGSPTAAERYTARILDTLAPRLRAGELEVKVLKL